MPMAIYSHRFKAFLRESVRDKIDNSEDEYGNDFWQQPIRELRKAYTKDLKKALTYNAYDELISDGDELVLLDDIGEEVVDLVEFLLTSDFLTKRKPRASKKENHHA